jgi:hypothetical protein
VLCCEVLCTVTPLCHHCNTSLFLGVGDLFLSLGARLQEYLPFFRSYSDFVNNYEQGIERLGELRAKSRKLEEFITQVLILMTQNQTCSCFCSSSC